MKKLSDIPKKNIFEVPEGYFEKLPGVIQSRVSEKSAGTSWSGSWGIALRYALPVVVIGVASVLWFRSTAPDRMDVQSELAQFAPEQLQQYLDEHDVLFDTDISTEEVLESSHWSKKDVEDLEKSVYSGYGASHTEIEQALDELDNEL